MQDKSIEITRIVRLMRGRSQSRLVEAEDGQFYIAKFAGHPQQGNRTLINEFLAYIVFERLQIETPTPQLLRLSNSELAADLSFEIGGCKTAIKAGIHFGSPCPVPPETTAIFDFIPRKLLAGVVNLADFAKILVVDKLLGKSDARQAVFARGLGADKSSLRVHFVDHKNSFGGSKWVVENLPETGLYFDTGVYSFINVPAICEQTIKLATQITYNDLATAIGRLPPEWFTTEDYKQLPDLISKVKEQQERLRDDVWRSFKALEIKSQPSASHDQVDRMIKSPANVSFMPAVC